MKSVIRRGTDTESSFTCEIYKSIVAKATELMNVSTEPSLLWWGDKVRVGHLGRGEESTLKKWWRKRDNLGKIS